MIVMSGVDLTYWDKAHGLLQQQTSSTSVSGGWHADVSAAALDRVAGRSAIGGDMTGTVALRSVESVR